MLLMSKKDRRERLKNLREQEAKHRKQAQQATPPPADQKQIGSFANDRKKETPPTEPNQP